MPRYDYECDCGLMWEEEHDMRDHLIRCGSCGRRARKVLSSPTVIMDQDWSSENGGRGRYCCQIGEKRNDPNAYCKSPRDAEEKAIRKGWTVDRC